jgi:hypothetical protein
MNNSASSGKGKKRKKWFYFFPVRLLTGYLKTNHLILLSWLFPFLFVFGVMGRRFGIPYLYLGPEYLGSINAYAFLFMGLVTGSFIMAFHISSYVVMAHRHPFIVTVRKPFYVYALNNSIIPLAYLLSYLIESFRFQTVYEFIPAGKALFNLLVFLVGVLIFVYLSFGFFYFMVRIWPRFIASGEKKLKEKKWMRWLIRISERDKEKKLEEAPEENSGKSRVEWYISSVSSVSDSLDFSHYDKSYLTEVFHQQHKNAFYYVVLILTFIIFRGLLKDHPALILPAGASLLLLFTLILLLTSLLYIVFRHWTFLVVLGLLFVGNFFSPFTINSYNNSAYGLDYSGKKARVNPQAHGSYSADSLATVRILDRWAAKNAQPSGKKPKMVIVCASGGGMKLAMWTYYAMAYADSTSHGKLMRHVQLFTGASGGMLGAAFLRELYLEKQQGKIKKLFSEKYIREITTDILNPVFYSFAMSDWFFRLQHFRYNGHRYYKDRAYLFEQTLDRNLGPVLDKPLIAYRRPEETAEIPMLILTPTIISTGSRLIISPVNVSYLTKVPYGQPLQNIEFRYNYRKFGADSLRFLTAIRMNASFPYVSPIVALPGEPRLSLFDAGLNDNYGFLTAYAFVMEFRKWILQHTSGIILIRIDENDYITYHQQTTFTDRLLQPLGVLFSDWETIQENNYLPVVASLKKILNGNFDLVSFRFGSANKRISLSWHLTRREIRILKQAIHSKENQKELQKLRRLLK